jgi:2-oxoglutarate/2-oxoacid ferredoxin oxidoreductase subunit beta
MTEQPTLTAKDFRSDQEVRWCPGCGDYSILANVQKATAASGISNDQTVFISGIGCAARFPYYMETYGFHTIHGRAPAFATGTKMANPDLTVWVATGDGDSLSIGGNHFIHVLRRNIDLQILLFNNEIYGLTKGQYSPTSPVGTVAKSTPMGSVDTPLSPAQVALGANGTFFARVIDTDHKMCAKVFEAALAHKGTALIEILQNCVIFNDGAFDHITERKTAKETQLHLVDGEPLRFGADGEKGIMMRGADPVVVTVGEDGVTEADLLVHSVDAGPAYAAILATLPTPPFPAPLGILWQWDRAEYSQGIDAQVTDARARRGDGDLTELLNRGNTWQVG